MRPTDVFDGYNDDDEREEARGQPLICKRCGSEDVRWRQQGGRWVLFSLKPGVEHRCPTPAEDFMGER